MEPLKRICKHCNKPLRKIGPDRGDFAPTHSDWAERKYHKKCWVIILNERNRKLEEKLLEERIKANKEKEEAHRKLMESYRQYWNETRLNNVVKFVRKHTIYVPVEETVDFLD